MKDILGNTKDTKTIIKRYIQELEFNGYLKRECIKDHGKFKWIWNIYETPNKQIN